jgi:tRNA pseudouridine55 synthase
LGEITGALASFVGEIEQVPPAYSAAKVAGRRAYKLARRGQEVTIKARKIIIHRIDLISYEYPQLQLEVRCGKGTYIRSLARDLGEKLRCGAFVETLRRTRVGLFGVEEAVPLDVAPEVARGRLLPLAAAVAGLGKVIFPTKVVEQLRSGKAISGKLCLNADPKGNDGLAAGFADDGTLLAILKHGQDKDDWQPIKVLMDIPKPASR